MNILVAEDDSFLRELICHSLANLGHRVLFAVDGPEALKLAQGQAIDLLLTDVVMPGGMNGLQLAEALKPDRPGLKVVYMSGYDPEVFGQNLPFELGVNFLRKPFDIMSLIRIIEAGLNGAS